MDRLLVAVDGSEHARTALRAAAALARTAGASLDVLAVVPHAPSFERHQELARPLLLALREDAKSYLKMAEEEAHARGVAKVRGALLEGYPAELICDHAAKHGHDLVVIGSRGLSTRRIHQLGSVGYDIAQLSPAPVLVVRGSEELRRVVAPIDGSPSAARAARWGATFARTADTRLVLLYVIPSATEEVKFTVTRAAGEPFLGPLADEIGSSGVAVAKRVEYGRPAETILRVAEESGADLIVLGRAGMGGPLGFTLGGVTDKILHEAKASLLVVP